MLNKFKEIFKISSTETMGCFFFSFPKNRSSYRCIFYKYGSSPLSHHTSGFVSLVVFAFVCVCVLSVARHSQITSECRYRQQDIVSTLVGVDFFFFLLPSLVRGEPSPLRLGDELWGDFWLGGNWVRRVGGADNMEGQEREGLET